jgi:hypothetical protein
MTHVRTGTVLPEGALRLLAPSGAPFKRLRGSGIGGDYIRIGAYACLDGVPADNWAR